MGTTCHDTAEMRAPTQQRKPMWAWTWRQVTHCSVYPAPARPYASRSPSSATEARPRSAMRIPVTVGPSALVRASGSATGIQNRSTPASRRPNAAAKLSLLDAACAYTRHTAPPTTSAWTACASRTAGTIAPATTGSIW